jgi:cobalt/nickel transport system permease protein
MDSAVSGLRAGVYQESLSGLSVVGDVYGGVICNGIPDCDIRWAEVAATRGLFLSRLSFIQKTIVGFTRTLSEALVSEKFAHRSGFLQSLDPRVRLLGVLVLVIAAVACRKIQGVGALFLVATLIAVLSSLDLWSLAKRVWIAVLIFTGLIALPAIFITPGTALWVSPTLGISISTQGVYSAAMLILRVETAATLTTTLVLCTPWTHVLKALRSLFLPAEIVTMLTMTHRYAFLLMETAQQMFESRESRRVGVIPGPDRRRMIGQTAGVLFSKSMELSQDVYLSMVSRGFHGDVYLFHEFRLASRDYAVLLLFLATGFLAVWMGR